ncbi:MAG TPA: stage II sporulation protein M [Pyrinomonadaceae bacterium]|nr:stage II sporulation protein M [Pyrinomonadaceae bacterium]
MNRFINERKDNWQRLEDLLTMLQGTSLRGLSKLEVREFGELYRRAATDLAIARAETRDPKLVNYLNSLVIRAHGKIYRAEGEGIGIIRKFFARDFPRSFRRSFRYAFIAFAVFMAFSVFSFSLSFSDADFGLLIGLDEIRVAAETDHRWWLRLNDANQIGSSEILTNNILVAFMAFAFGAFFGIGTLYVLMMNGISIGGVLGVCYRTNPGFGNELVTFMVGHGVLELSAIFIAGGAGMMIGYSLINPGDLTRTQALKKTGNEAARIVIGCACILFVAGLIEGFISPSSLPAAFKYGTGIFTGLVLFSYLYFAGRKPDEVVESSV